MKRIVTLLAAMILPVMAMAQQNLVDAWKPYSDRMMVVITALPDHPTPPQIAKAQVDCDAIAAEFNAAIVGQVIWYAGFADPKGSGYVWADKLGGNWRISDAEKAYVVAEHAHHDWKHEDKMIPHIGSVEMSRPPMFYVSSLDPSTRDWAHWNPVIGTVTASTCTAFISIDCLTQHRKERSVVGYPCLKIAIDETKH